MNKHLKTPVLTCIMLIHFIGIVYSQTDRYIFRHLTTEDGMPNNFAYKIYKDSKGFIWITTRGGLCRYDGYNFKVFIYDPDDSTTISNDYHKCNITEDSAGYLWVGSQNGLNRFDPVTETFKRYYHDPDNPQSICGNIIFCIYCDREGTVWIGGINHAGLNKYNPETDDFTLYRLNPEDSINRQLFWGANRILGMYEDREGIFWLGTSIGLYQFDRQTGEFIPSKPITPMGQWIDNRFSTIAEDEEGKLFYVADWIYTYDRSQEWLDLYQPLYKGRLASRNQGFMDILLDPNDGGKTIWITKGRYLYSFDRQTGRMDSTCYDPLNSRSIIGGALKGMYVDISGMIWVAGNSGVNIMENNNTGIEKHIEFAEEFNDDAISFLKDSDGFCWIGTSESGLLKFDSNMKLLKWYKSSLIDTNSNIFFGTITKIIEDRNHNLWMICNTDRLYFYDRETDQIKPCVQLMSSTSHPRFVFDIYEDSQGFIWIAARPGLYYHRPGEDLNICHLITANNTLRTFTSSSIIEDHLGNLWISILGQGLYCQLAKFRGTDEFVSYIHDPHDSTSISNDNVWKVYEDNTGTIWASTSYGLNRYNRKEDNFTRVFFKNDIGANFIKAIIGDENGSLWLASESGLMRFDPGEITGNNNLIPQLKEVIPFKDFSTHRLFTDECGQIYVPAKGNSGNGYFSFYPDSLVENRQIPPIVITDFLIRNDEVKLDSSINIKKHLKLNHNENYISFEFAALDYTDPGKNQYAYMLEGLDQDWIYSKNRRFVTYTKIPAGNYTFRVKGSNNDGYWNETGTSVVVTILSPPWKTWWAYSLYAIFLLALFYTWRKYDLKRQRLKQDLELEHLQTEKLEELDKMKSRFFANISHEFRTPLTLILGPLAKHLPGIKDQALKKDLSVIQRNALRLQRLINQLLTLSKLESGKMKLEVREENIVKLVREYTQSFESLATQKGIKLEFESETDEIMLWVDQDKMEKILYNLLSNAFKFTGEGGAITVQVIRLKWNEVKPSDIPPKAGTQDARLRTQNSVHSSQFTVHYVCISVSDTGSGISADKLPHIFDRFYQADDTYKADTEGTGIGLALTKELVELHHGQIVGSSEKGVGSRFDVYLPLGESHLQEDEKEKREKREEKREMNWNIELTTDNRQLTTDSLPAIDSDKPILLIVEDNADLRSYIRGFLDESYKVEEAINGKEGLERALEQIPDLVISDVMMPEMDGIELCKKLKTDTLTCHIPVILLTARASSESKLEGLETGADEYLSKPFDPKELQVRIKNLIAQRELLREKFSSDIPEGEQRPLLQIPSGIGKMDRAFLQHALDVVEKQMAETEFDVVYFGSDMSLSRQQLHRKLKGLTGLSATEFIRKIRLNKAASLLASRSGTVSEIAYDVGFNTLSYFTKCFQEQFGITPSQYIEEHTQK